MTKKLDTTSITNELSQTAFFRQSPQPVKQQETPTPSLPENPVRQEEQPNGNITDRATARPNDQLTGKGILVRRGFEWREDQLRALKKLSLKEQLEGKPGSMSQMVRDALDEYLRRRAAEE